MKNYEFTISILNANSAINQIHKTLSSRDIKVGKSDIKELVSELLGFETSNILDAKLKRLQEKQVYNKKTGQHKAYPNVVLKRFKNPQKIFDFLSKYKQFQVVVEFSDSFEFKEGFSYKEGDILFAQSYIEVLEALVEWSKHTSVDYMPFEEECLGGREYEGYWALRFEGEGMEEVFGETVRFSHDTRDYKGCINSPCSNIEEITKVLVGSLDQYGLPFFISNRKEFEEYLQEWIEEHFVDNYDIKTMNEYVQYIEKYLPYIGIKRIIKMEVGNVPVECLKKLKAYGAKFDEPELMVKAAKAGSLSTCRYLIESGNTVEMFYDLQDMKWPAPLHSEASSEKLCEGTKNFFTVVHQLEVDINSKDNQGNTPLHCASIYGNEELYKHLVNLGAKEDLKNFKNDTPKSILKRVKREKELEPAEVLSSFFEGIF